jgi:hypothetical protein
MIAVPKPAFRRYVTFRTTLREGAVKAGRRTVTAMATVAILMLSFLLLVALDTGQATRFAPASLEGTIHTRPLSRSPSGKPLCVTFPSGAWPEYAQDEMSVDRTRSRLANRQRCAWCCRIRAEGTDGWHQRTTSAGSLESENPGTESRDGRAVYSQNAEPM